MLNEEQHQIIADALELAKAEKNEFVDSDFILFAKGLVEKGEKSVDKIVSHFFN